MRSSTTIPVLILKSLPCLASFSTYETWHLVSGHTCFGQDAVELAWAAFELFTVLFATLVTFFCIILTATGAFLATSFFMS